MTEKIPRSKLLFARVVVGVMAAFVLGGILAYGLAPETLARVWQNLVDRPGGPMVFRFFLTDFSAVHQHIDVGMVARQLLDCSVNDVRSAVADMAQHAIILFDQCGDQSRAHPFAFTMGDGMFIHKPVDLQYLARQPGRLFFCVLEPCSVRFHESSAEFIDCHPACNVSCIMAAHAVCEGE